MNGTVHPMAIRLIFLWALLPVACAAAQSAATQSPTPQPTTPQTLRIYLPPPRRWDNQMLNDQPALAQTPTDFANLTGGFRFGMSPAQVNALLPDPLPAVDSAALPIANEFPGDIHYLGVPLAAAGPLRLQGNACAGQTGYVVFLFNQNGLFRISYRLIADRVCPDTADAARAIFARYVAIGPSVALSVRYRTGTAHVVDITDPTASFLIPVRWNQGG